MARDPIVFAMANPVPEIMPEEAARPRRRHGDGTHRLPEPDQQRAVLPRHLPRRARSAGRDAINEEMKLAAASAIADIIPDDELHRDYIVPCVFDRRVARGRRAEVDEAAIATGVARRSRAEVSLNEAEVAY